MSRDGRPHPSQPCTDNEDIVNLHEASEAARQLVGWQSRDISHFIMTQPQRLRQVWNGGSCPLANRHGP